MNKVNKPGNGAAVIIALIAVAALILAIPQVVLTLVGLLALGGFMVYSLDKPKRKDSIGSRSHTEHKPLPAHSRAAKPPPPPPPHLQQTTDSTHQRRSEIDVADESRVAAPIQSESIIVDNTLLTDFLPVEKPSTTDSLVSRDIGQPYAPKTVTRSPLVTQKDNIDDPVSVAHTQPSSITFRVPRAPKSYGEGLWIPCGESITIRNTTIPGGMIYVGSRLKGDYGINDPCLIDPTKPVAEHGDYTKKQMGYWPSYSDISSTARRAYLNWLSDGRRDPAADIGFVFLFFYGLEHRLIVDTLSDESAQADLPIIAAELRRLLSIYGEKSNSFYGYAREFLDWIMLSSFPSRLYEQPLPELSRSLQLPLHLRLALGQAAMDGTPVPPSLALSWAKLERNITLRTPATRCPMEFDQLFLTKYAEMFDKGFVLPRSKARLRFVYRPASAGLRSGDSLIKVLDDVPDVTVLTAPIKKLEQVVDAVTKDLEPFSRLIARNPLARDTHEALLRLPTSLWPESLQKRLLQFKERVAEGMVTLKYEEALYSLFGEASAGKDSIAPLARILESICVGIEPNVLFGAKPPKPDEKIVLFALPSSDDPPHSDGPFMLAELTLQLASAVAAADGVFSTGEAAHLREQVNSWGHLTQGQKRRLLAHIELLYNTPASLKSLKKKIDKHTIADRRMIAESITKVALLDGDAPPEAVKILEKIYKVLGVSSSRLFSDLHAVASGSEASLQQVSEAVDRDDRFTLNRERIAARQADTDKVQALLANIFSDSDDSESESEENALPSSPPLKGAYGEMLLGLDQAHSTLARRMLARQEWSREDLLQMAEELDLMLDGALEYINDAAFEAFNMPFIESDSPIVLNPEILGMLTT